MKKNGVVFLISFLLIFLIQNNRCISQNNKFPTLEKGNISLTFGDKKFADNYSILDSSCEQTNKWVADQDDYFKSYLKSASKIYNYKDLKNTANYSNSNFDILGKDFFRIMYNEDGQAIYKSDIPTAHGALLIVSNNDVIIEKDKYALFRSLHVSKNSNYLAYTYSINGTDILKLKILDLKKNKHLNDKIEGLDWDEIQWFKDGFFYSKFDSTTIFYHKLNTSIESDSLVIPSATDSKFKTEVLVLNKERYLLMLQKNLKTKTTSIFYIDLTSLNKDYHPLIQKNQDDIKFVDANDTLIYFTLNSGQYKNNLFYIDPKYPTKWHLLIDEKNELLEDVKIIDNHIIASFKKGPISKLRLYNKLGELYEIVEMPIGYSISKVQGKNDSKSFYFNLSSFLCPAITYEYSWKRKSYMSVETVSITYEISQMEFIYQEITSYDNKKIPILIAKNKNTKLSNAPTLLESYGGYGIKFENNFEPDIVQFINYGGVYVRAYIRGGGELGEEWHKDGSGINKSNTYLDFISTAKYLTEKNYTNSKKLAISGGSHGGLVVGVALTQHPELFKVAICNAAPLDIATILNDKNSLFQFNEYGDMNDKNERDSILKYNPYFNVKENINYPSLFVYASEADERVNWSNSAKFVALVQNRVCQTNPILFFLERDAGHFGAEKTYDLILERRATQNLFLIKELGMDIY